MKVVILAGGLGTRLAEVTSEIPKPMARVGPEPMLMHIMRVYAAHGFTEFVIALGYRGEVIRDYFTSYRAMHSDLTVHLDTGAVEYHRSPDVPWQVHLIDTGASTMTGGRIKRLAPILKDEPFMLTYGDGIGNVDLNALLEYHREHGKWITVTAVHPVSRYGKLVIEADGTVSQFVEKPQFEDDWINGGFFVMEPDILDHIDGDDTVLEREPLERAARRGQLQAYRHAGFWHSMDTLRDLQQLNELWRSTTVPPWLSQP